MRPIPVLIRAVTLALLLLTTGGAWAESKPCEDGGASSSSGGDSNSGGGHNNPCMDTVTTIAGLTELYVGETSTYTGTNNSGKLATWTWSATGSGEVKFILLNPPGACKPLSADGITFDCATTSAPQIVGVKQGKVTIKVEWVFCGDSTKFCNSCATYDIVVLDNQNSKPPEKMPLGAKYRRVDVHGVPMPDPSPTGEGEQDRLPNMAYTDMYSLAPTYAVSDVAVPMEGGELALEFRRTMSIKSRNYNVDVARRSISYPTSDLLGLGWDTNLGSRVVISTDQDSQGVVYTAVRVVDETGNGLDYTAGASGTFAPDISHTYNNLALRATLQSTTKDGRPALLLTKTHGTKLYFFAAGNFDAPVVGNACSTTLARTQAYWRLEQIIDRNGNRLDYHYKPKGTGGTRHADVVVTDIQDFQHPERTVTFDIAYDASRDEGGGFDVGDSGWRLNSVTDPLGRVVTFAYADGQGLHAQLASVTRPKVESDPLTPGSPLVAPVVRFSYFVKDLTDVSLDPLNPAHGPAGSNRFAAPGTITDARGLKTVFTYDAEWYPTAFYANLGNLAVYQQRLYVTSEATVDANQADKPVDKIARFKQETKPSPTVVTTSVTDTRGTKTVFKFTGSVVTGLPTNTGAAIIVERFTRTTSVTGSSALVADFTWSQDLNGNLVKVIDLSGNTIEFAYHSGTPGDPFDQPVLGGVHDDNLNPYFYQVRDKPSSRTVDRAGLNLFTQYAYEPIYCKEVKTIDAEGKVTTEDIDSRGNRTAVHEPLGKTTLYHYDAEGFIDSTTDPDQRVTTTTKDFTAPTAQHPGTALDKLQYRTVTTVVTGVSSDVRIKTVAISDIMGNQRTTYDPRGCEGATLVDDFKTTALFDDLNRQTSVSKPPVEVSPGGALARTTSETHYDLNGNVARTVDDEGNVSITTYDLMNRATATRRRMTSPLTNDDANDLVTGATYNEVGLPATSTDARGLVTDFAYDAMLRLTTKTLPTVTQADGSTARYTEQYTYGTNAGSGAFTHWSGWQPTRVVNTRGFATDTTYDAIYRPQHVISRLTTTALPGDAPAAGEPMVTKTYNKVHKVVTESSRNETFAGTDQTRTTTYAYDDLYRVVKTTVSLDAGDLVTKAEYDLAGDVTATTDAQNNRTDTTYDGARRPRFRQLPAVLVTDPAGFNATGGTLRPTTETRYDTAGNVVLTIDANHTQTRKSYDNRNRLTETIIDVDGDGAFDGTTYHAKAQSDIATTVHYNRVDKVVAARDGRGGTTTTAYDRAYRVVQVTQPASDYSTNAALSPVVKTAYDKDGNVTDMTDPLQHVTHTAYDQLNRVRTVTQVFEVTTANPDTVVTESQYDAGNNVTALILHNSGFGGTGDQKTTYAYDGLNRKLSETLPSPDGKARVTTMGYYRNGQLRTSKDALGQLTELEYDRAGRMVVSRHKRADASLEETRAYQYNGVGKPTIIDDLTGRTAYTYDAVYRVTAEVRTPAASLGQAVYEVDSGYDALGARTRVQYPGSSRTLVSTADRAGRIVKIQDAGRTTTYQFDANGNRLSVQEPNGVRTDNTLDALNRCTTALSQNASAALVSRYDYQFDLVGNRTRVDENLPPQPLRGTVYTYDHQYRLTVESLPTGVTPAFSNTYAYDPAGNRQKLTAVRGTVTTVTTYVCDALNRLLTTAIGTATTTYGYDLNGNQISQVIPGGPTISFVWDTHNRLVGGNALAAGSGAATASYDYRTRRQTKTVGGVTTFYRYDQGVSFQELGGSAIKEEIIRGSDMGGGIGSILYTDRTLAGGPVENFSYNPSVGHVTSLTNDTGVVTETNRFDAFGNIISISGSSSNNHLANTKERDASLPGVFVLDNHGMRYYNPVTGRYISRDPKGYPNGLDNYLYVNNNPANRIDPLGLWWGSEYLGYIGAALVERGAQVGAAIGHAVVQTAATIADAATGTAGAIAYGVSGDPRAMNIATSLSDTSKALESGDLSTGDAALNAIPGFRAGEKLGEAGIAAANGDTDAAVELASDGLIAAGIAGLTKGRSLASEVRVADAVGAGGEAAGADGAASARSGGTCDANGEGKCFIAGTLVATESGEVPIEEVKAGDRVWAYDLDADKAELETVLRTFVRETDDTATIRFDGQAPVTCTWGHPFWVVGQGWTEAVGLQRGDEVLCLDGQHHAVSYVEVAHWSTRVYNFEVEKDHDYFVSKLKVLAHNTCGNPSNGLGVNDPPTRVQGPWTERDLARAEEGKGPLDMTPKTDKNGLEKPLELHHADQMPGSAIHEVDRDTHRLPGVHGQRSQGVTPEMRKADAQLHWKLRGQEMGPPPPPPPQSAGK